MKSGSQDMDRFSSIVVDADSLRTREVSDDEDAWPGLDLRRILTAGVNEYFRKYLINILSLRRNKDLANYVLSASKSNPASIEVSPCKLSVLGWYTSSGDNTQFFIDWLDEFSRDSDSSHIDWRKEFENTTLVEGDRLDVVSSNYLIVSDGELSRDIDKEENVTNWQDVKQINVK